jgi:threonine dehydrogenase-like Zn-dependent dehydrogenase
LCRDAAGRSPQFDSRRSCRGSGRAVQSLRDDWNTPDRSSFRRGGRSCNTDGFLSDEVCGSAILLGAQQVIAIDNVPERLAMARAGGATTINFDEESVVERLNDLTDGKGPEKCIDAVGMEAHAGGSFDAVYDKVKQTLMLETDRPHVLREMMYVCRPAGTLSIPGVYGGLLDKIPFGAAMNKGLTIRMGQTHVNRWTDDLLRRIEEGQIDPSFVVTHRVDLEDGPGMYKTFRDKEDGCVKVVLRP